MRTHFVIPHPTPGTYPFCVGKNIWRMTLLREKLQYLYYRTQWEVEVGLSYCSVWIYSSYHKNGVGDSSSYGSLWAQTDFPSCFMLVFGGRKQDWKSALTRKIKLWGSDCIVSLALLPLMRLSSLLHQECTQAITLYSAQKIWNMIPSDIQWFLFCNSICATLHLEAGAFIRTQNGLAHPDIQYHILPSAFWDHGHFKVETHAYQVKWSYIKPSVSTVPCTSSIQSVMTTRLHSMASGHGTLGDVCILHKLTKMCIQKFWECIPMKKELRNKWHISEVPFPPRGSSWLLAW